MELPSANLQKISCTIQDVLNLVLAKGYLTKLLANKPVARYLKQKQPELLTEFEAIVQAASLDH